MLEIGQGTRSKSCFDLISVDRCYISFWIFIREKVKAKGHVLYVVHRMFRWPSCMTDNCTAVSCREGMRCGHHQMLYADTYRAMLCLAMEQLTGNTSAFMMHWEPDNLLGTSAKVATKLIKEYPRVVRNI